jgi:hypothetical protein
VLLLSCSQCAHLSKYVQSKVVVGLFVERVDEFNETFIID